MLGGASELLRRGASERAYGESFLGASEGRLRAAPERQAVGASPMSSGEGGYPPPPSGPPAPQATTSSDSDLPSRE